ncbi:hypothetical protein V495_00943 [Pseudogymnoascus sp. VKM F-4514 (FW-929)]|nr:hypothetical protein V495_00943 [Pseudogymnoascus sp. VKM F-4514 (FW-929)]KFY66875.1 hypothetical protein V497_00658 [Pseudogymnoascus sp. VKM F-4516 (FW-969)]
MFYSHEILTSRKYEVATVWLVGTLGPTSSALKVKRKQILGVDVRKACETIIQPEAPLALRLQSSLLYGVSRVYNQQCGYVLHDAQAAQNNLRALLKVVKNNAIDLDAGAARPDQLILMDDPTFEPGLDLPSLPPLDFSTLDQGFKDSQYSMLSSLKSSNASMISNSQASLLGLQIPHSDSDITGQFQLPGHFQLESSAQKTPSGVNPFDGDEPGLLDDLDFEFDADGALIEVDAEELRRRRGGVYPAGIGRLESDSAASERVRRDHEDALIGRPDRLDDDGDFIIPMDDEMNILPDAEAFPQRQGAKMREDDESSVKESSVSAGVPMKKKRQRKASKVVSGVDARLEIRSAELTEWQTSYVQNMTKDKHAKVMRAITKQAVANASIFIWGNGIGGIGKTIRASGNVPHPLDIFQGDKLKELLNGVTTVPGKGKKRARSIFDENDEELARNVRARDDLEPQLPRAVGDDAFMPNFDDEMMPYQDDSTGIELPREVMTPLADHHSSAMPWNVSASINSFRQRSSSVVPGQGRHSSVVPGRPSSRLQSASPLLGRGRLLSDNGLDLPARGPGSMSALDVDEEYEALGPSAAVDTQTAQNSQWVADALETESLNFLEFVRCSHAEAEADLEDLEIDDEPEQKWVGFETLFPPHESHRIVAAQAFHHVLSLATKNLLRVTQEEGGEVQMLPDRQGIFRYKADKSPSQQSRHPPNSGSVKQKFLASARSVKPIQSPRTVLDIMIEVNEKAAVATAGDSKYAPTHPTSATELPETAVEKALVRKVDMHIIPLIILLYLFSFLDRVNIGNARLYGMEEELNLQGNQYQIAVSILFVTYCGLEVPSNLLLKKFQPGRYIAVITITWGVIATLSGLVRSFGSLVACRLLLGIFEAGLFPGLITYLTLFYSRRQLAVRIGYLFTSAAVAGACGGLIAYGISFMDGAAGLSGWRWIFILEGIPSVLVGIACIFFLPNNVETAYFLTEDERKLMLNVRFREVGQTPSSQKFHWADVKEGAKDFQLWAFSIAQFGEDVMLYGFSTFLPTIIKGIGHWTVAESQALTVPVYALGAITYLIVAWISDRTQQRGLYTCVFAVVSMVGYGMLLSHASSGVSYAGCFLVAMGLYVSVGLPLAWLPGNLPRYGKRTLASGLQLMFGNIAGIATPFMYPTGDGPNYIMGHATSLSMVGMAAVIYLGMIFYYAKVNKDRTMGREDWKIEGKTDAEIEEMGDRSPRYVYAT